MLLKLFFEFLKIGLFTFGGGYAMIPLIRESVFKNNWLTEEQFLNMIGLSEVTPGPIAINMATFVGSTQAGFIGSLVATIGVVLPSFVIMLLIAIILKNIIKNKYVQSALNGFKYVAVALILASAITISLTVLFSLNNTGKVAFSANTVAIKTFVVIVAGYFLLKIATNKKPGPISIIFLSAIVGLLINLVS